MIIFLVIVYVNKSINNSVLSPFCFTCANMFNHITMTELKANLFDKVTVPRRNQW